MAIPKKEFSITTERIYTNKLTKIHSYMPSQFPSAVASSFQFKTSISKKDRKYC